MRPFSPVSIVRWMLLAIALQPFSVMSSMRTYEKLRKTIIRLDDEVIQGIERTIRDGEERIQNLTTLLRQYSKTPKTDYQFQADHPNDFYLLVKNHVLSWYGGDIDMDLLPALEEVIRSRNISFPILHDLEEAALAVLRLQRVYKLKAQDMFEGNYVGYKGPSLDIEDAYMLGSQAFKASHYPEAREWLQISVDLLTELMDNKIEEEQGGTSSEVLRNEYLWSLSLLGRTHFKLHDVEKAREMYERCSVSQPGTEHDASSYIEDVLLLQNDLKIAKCLFDEEESYPSDSIYHENNTDLCSLDKDHRLPIARPHHVCRYKSDPFIPYRRFREEILSTSPYVSVFYDVIHDSEIERLKDLARQTGLKRARVGGRTSKAVSDIRTGEVMALKDDDDPVVDRLSWRVKAFTRLEAAARRDMDTHRGNLQVLNYGMGGHYDLHFDAFSASKTTWENRLATVLFYLTDVEKGGATIFPRVGISVKPVKGMALFWYNIQPHMEKRDWKTLHAGCPVVIGNKWIANKWIWTNGNTFRRPCGPSPQSTQQDVENIVSLDALKQIV